MFELAFVLATPLVTAILLALFGHHRRAPEINSAGSLLTLIAAGLRVVFCILAEMIEGINAFLQGLQRAGI